MDIEAGVEMPDQADAIPCRTVDVSEGGVRLRAARPLRPGETVLVVLDAPDSTLVITSAVVCDDGVDIAVEGTTRLEFTDMTEANRERLRLLLDDPFAITSGHEVARLLNVLASSVRPAR